MKKIFLTISVFSFSVFTVSAQSITGNGENAKNDTLAVAEKAESTATEYRHLQALFVTRQSSTILSADMTKRR